MQVVGDFIGLHTDGGRRDLVDGAVERLGVGSGEHVGENLAQQGEGILPEGPAAPHHVFPEA